MKARMKAVSPIVAILLLIVVAVSATLLLYLWLSGFVPKATRTPSEMKTEFRIEAVKLDSANNKITVYLRNTGRTTLNIDELKRKGGIAVYVYESSTGTLVYQMTVTDNPPQGVTITTSTANGDSYWEPGELLTVEISDSNLSLTQGNYYDIKVTIVGIEDVASFVKCS